MKKYAIIEKGAKFCQIREYLAKQNYCRAWEERQRIPLQEFPKEPKF